MYRVTKKTWEKDEQTLKPKGNEWISNAYNDFFGYINDKIDNIPGKDCINKVTNPELYSDYVSQWIRNLIESFDSTKNA